ncbi:MAG: hypothetical protein Q7R42_05665 [Candidatus Planktophila sp.]|nr:hypothetical protein [Candidatus Planktophila sp.]
MKKICDKLKDQTIFLENSTGKPEIVLIFPITRDVEKSSDKWMTVLEFVASFEISTLLVIDKTEQGSATDYFMDHFEIEKKRLFVLPRSIKDTLFDTVGEIVLDKNMWIIQLHDDDHWSGKITLPESVNAGTVYFSDFYLYSDTKGSIQIDDYSMPNRIVFSLVPSMIWNRFAKLVQDQRYHVAGSFDFTLNMMAQLACKFDYQPGFKYYWKDDNWDTSKNAIAHLTRLAESDGWEGWSSPEIANFNRSIDSLASLKYVKDLLNPTEIEKEIGHLIKGLRPSYRKRLKYGFYISAMYSIVEIRKLIFKAGGAIDIRSLRLLNRLSLYRLIVKTWRLESIENIIDLIVYIESQNRFEKLQVRFQFWKQALAELNKEF